MAILDFGKWKTS